MPRSASRTLAFAALVLPLALGLAACKGSDTPAAAPTGAAIAKIAAPAGKNWAETFSVTPEGGYLVGNPAAPVKLIEFGALSCSHCAEFSELGSEKLIGDYVSSGRVSYELRLFMLNQLDVPAALLATCGSPDAVIPLAEQFWAWQPNMFKNLQGAGEDQMKAIANLPPDQQFAAIAKTAGMSEFFAARGIAADQGAACLASKDKATALVNQTQQAGEKYGISGTPTFYLNGANVGTHTWETLEPLLQAAGAR